jgi:hypothetical protein
LFAAIWSRRESGEDTEDAILRRILNIAPPSPSLEEAFGDYGNALERQFLSDPASGLYDARYNASFPAGFEIFRVYKGKEYRAQAIQNLWIRGDNATGYRTLNDLSRSIGTKTENAWISWFFKGEDGKSHPLSERRDPSRITKRTPEPVKRSTNKTAEELGL